MTDTRCKIVEKHINELAKDHGDIVSIKNLSLEYNYPSEWLYVTFLGIREDGVCDFLNKVYKGVPKVYKGTAHLENAELKHFVDLRIKNFMKSQEKLAKIYKIKKAKLALPDEIYLEKYTIDKPLNAIMKEVLGDRRFEYYRNVISGYTAGIRQIEDEIASQIPESFADISRQNLSTRFSIKDERHKIAWSSGSVMIYNLILPEQILTTLIGRPLGEVIEHKWFHPDMIISGYSLMNKSGGGIALNIKNPTEKII